MFTHKYPLVVASQFVRAPKKFRGIASTLVLTSLLPSTNAIAEESQDKQRIEEVEIVGERATNLHDMSTSVGLVDKKLLNDTAINTLEDSYRLMVNASAPTSPRDGFTIRGVSERGLGQAPVNLPLANMYIDGVLQSRIAELASNRTLWDTQQVAVFRGPQVTTFGKTSLAGAVNVVSSPAVHQWQVAARTRFTTLEDQDYALMFNAPLVQDILALRVSAQTSDSDSDISYPGFDNASERSPSEGHFEQYRGILRLDPLDALTLQYVYNHTNAKPVNQEITFTESPYKAPRINTDSVELNHAKVDNHSLTAFYQINEMFSVSALSAYSAGENKGELYFSRPPTNEFTQENKNHENNELYSQELRFNYQSPTSETAGHIGVYYFNLKSSNVLDFGPGFSQSQTVGVTDTNAALFGMWHQKLSDHWYLNIGGRYDNNTFVTDLDLSGDTSKAEGTDDVFLPDLGVEYRFDPQMSLLLTYRQGYRPGGTGAIFMTPDFYSYKPESTDDIELVWRARLMDGRLDINANLFYNYWKDQQYSRRMSRNPNDIRIYNIDRSSLSGLEISGRFLIDRGFNVFAALGLLSTSIDQVDENNPVLEPLLHDSFPRAPSTSFVLGANYQHPTGFFVSTDMRYNGATYSQIPNRPGNRIKDYAVVNANTGYRNDYLQVRVFATNLFNNHYLRALNTRRQTAVPGGRQAVGMELEVFY